MFQPSTKSPSCQSQAMRASVQQIIDKYTKDLDASLRTGSVHPGESQTRLAQIFPEIMHTFAHPPVVCVDAGVNISSVSWSSLLQQELSHDEDMCERQSSAVDLSNAELTGEVVSSKFIK